MIDLPKEIVDYFPYAEVRPYQDEFIKIIHAAVANRSSVLIEGSNGLGKTIAAISACLPKAAEENLKVLYIARTHRQNERVIEELKTVSKKQPVSGISIRGRREMCLNSFAARPDLNAVAVMEVCEMLKAKHLCSYYRGIEDREDEYLELMQNVAGTPCKASEIQRICQKRGFCPYELAKAALSEVNVIASSYLYVFDPAIRGHFLKNLETPLDKIILIVDEAHNLPDTAINIASSTLSLFTIKQAIIEAKKHGYREIAGFARVLETELEKSAAKIDCESLVSPEFVVELVKEKAHIDDPKEFSEHLKSAGSVIKRNQLKEGKYPRSFIHGMAEFMQSWLETVEDQSYVNVISKYVSRRGAPTAKLEIVALDPSKITEPIFSSVYLSVVMSGTLQPLEAYARITKLPENTIQSVLPSPFPKEHILPMISCGVTTAMDKRTPLMFCKIINRICEVVENTPANTGIFTPSFEVLESLLANGLEKAISKRVFSEHRGMSTRENERVVAAFKACSKQNGAVLLGVQGGRSSEGVDYPGDQMNSVVIIGVPYAEPTSRVKAQIDYFEKCFPSYGREYGYIIPAMKKASQAAGRPIRTLEDRGAMIFLDYRFASPYVQSFLPLWIRENLRILPDEDGAIGLELKSFFKKAY